MLVCAGQRTCWGVGGREVDECSRRYLRVSQRRRQTSYSITLDTNVCPGFEREVLDRQRHGDENCTAHVIRIGAHLGRSSSRT